MYVNTYVPTQKHIEESLEYIHTHAYFKWPFFPEFPLHRPFY